MRKWWRPNNRRDELDEEIQSHLRMAVEDHEARGQRPAAARLSALREFGNVALVQDVTYNTWRWTWLERLGQDLHYAVRQLWRAPGFTLTVALSLALGIGANTTIFSFVNALLFRAPAIADSSHLVELMNRDAKASGIESYLPLSYPGYTHYRDHNQTLSGLAAFDGDPRPVSWSNSGQAQLVHGQIVSGNFFTVAGIQPVLGRTFVTDDDNSANPHPVIVISHAFWQQKLAADQQVLGRTIVLNGNGYTIVGVAPAAFTGILIGMQPDFWAPLAMAPVLARDPDLMTSSDTYWLYGLGRIKPDVSHRQAQAELSVLSRSLPRSGTNDKAELDATIFPVQLIPGPYRGYVAAFTGFLMVVVGLVLLIACANVANLLLARSLKRNREFAVRAALGASTGRLLRQTVTESILLTLLGGGCGILLALWSVPLLIGLKPASLPLSIAVPLDARVLTFTLVISVLTGIVFGAVPMLRSRRRALLPALKDEALSAGSRRGWLRDALVIAQVTVCMVLLIGAGLCLRSLLNARNIDPGFDTHNLVLAQLDPGGLGYSEAKGRTFYDQLLQRIRTTPGVTSASLANYLPLSTERAIQGVSVDGFQPPEGEKDFRIQAVHIDPGFLGTMGVPILSGRDFAAHDMRPGTNTAIINTAMAKQFWPKRNPIGQHFKSGDQLFEVIGLVKTGKYRALSEDPQPFLYLPFDYSPQATLVVRSQQDPQALFTVIRQQVRDLDQNAVPVDLETISQFMALPLFPAHTTGILLSACGAVALLLAMTGLYGVISYSVTRRTREIGVRMALGADRRMVTKLVLREGMFLTAIGIVVGLLISFAVTRLLSTLLYGIKPSDPLIFSSVTLMLFAVAFAACLIPARRAASVEPTQALRAE
ncbi:MAG TPA: ABC transporter permease [Candidatus Koribacter sp.]|jgi:predicted permease